MAKLAILVPVLGRKNQIAPLLKSIEGATEVDHRVVFICSPRDPARLTCKKSGCETIVVEWEPDRADFAKKINKAFRETDDEWLFQGATDLVFHPNWDTNALRLGEAGFGVVGTNDLGNPSVQRGLHSTHILFSRDYIEKFDGGTYDNTGIVFSEAYDHQFVDTEFIQVAIMRGQFKPCLRSIVEHMHPHWRKGEMDPTYDKSMRSFKEDAALHNLRMRAARHALGIYPSGARRRRGRP